MPQQPKRPCRRKGCPALVGDGTGYCPTHLASKRRTYDRDRRPERHKLYATAPWRRLRERKVNANPICEVCNNALAALVHHIKPIETHPELALEWSNLQSICRPCHDQAHKHIKTEQVKGREDAGGDSGD